VSGDIGDFGQANNDYVDYNDDHVQYDDVLFENLDFDNKGKLSPENQQAIEQTNKFARIITYGGEVDDIQVLPGACVSVTIDDMRHTFRNDSNAVSILKLTLPNQPKISEVALLLGKYTKTPFKAQLIDSKGNIQSEVKRLKHFGHVSRTGPTEVASTKLTNRQCKQLELFLKCYANLGANTSYKKTDEKQPVGTINRAAMTNNHVAEEALALVSLIRDIAARDAKLFFE